MTRDDINDEQAEVGDVPDIDPIDRVEESLAELERRGELDSERVSFTTKRVGGVPLHEVNEFLDDLNHEDHPIKIIVEPEHVTEQLGTYTIEFIDLYE